MSLSQERAVTSLPICCFVISAIRNIKTTSISYSQVKKVISRTEYEIEFFENQYGSVTVVFAERGKGKSSQAPDRR